MRQVAHDLLFGSDMLFSGLISWAGTTRQSPQGKKCEMQIELDPGLVQPISGSHIESLGLGPRRAWVPDVAVSNTGGGPQRCVLHP